MRSPRVWIGLAFSALFLALLLWKVDRAELAAALREVRPGWLAAAVVVELVALWVRGARWRVVLGGTARVSTPDAVSLLLIGYAANNLLPLRVGEFVRAQLLNARTGASRMAALGTIVVERILDVLVLALFVSVTLAVAGSDDTAVRSGALLVTAGALAATGCIALLALWPRFAEICLRVLWVAPISVRPRMQRLLGNFLTGLSALRGPGPWAAAAGLSFVTWTLEAAAFWLVGESFGLALDPALYLAVCGAATLAIAAPSTAGGVGPFEVSASLVLGAFGVESGPAAAYALVMHAVLIVPVVVIGILLLWRQQLGIGTLVRAASTRGADEVTGVTAP